jgi:p-cumate 2,3-dioxygenase subunit alpha
MNLDELVVDDLERGLFRVDRSVMTSEQILAAERTNIFDRFWLYLGHDSEVGKPGDFLRRSRSGRPLIFLRNQAGEVDAFYDTCPHRGTTICREEQGNAKRFTCFYHAWTFDTFGRLVSLPDDSGYGPGFDPAERSLTRPPRLESYRGFWFVSFNPAVEALYDYLAGAREYIDLVVDQAEEGMRILEGSNRYSTRANWKLLVENSVDGYHGLPVHQTYFAYVKSLGGGISSSNLVGAGPRQLGNGHAVLEGEAPYGRPIARWDNLFGEDSREEIAAIRAGLVDKWGEERAYRMADTFRNLVVFPNLVLNDITAITVRYFEPVAPDLLYTDAWALVPREEQGSRLSRRIDSYLTFIGPGGFATPDDVEALESCQKGFAAQAGVRYSDVSRGMNRVPEILDELQMRAWWRSWAAAMAGRTLPDPVSLPESPCVGAASQPVESVL